MAGTGFMAEWLHALRHASENPVAGWLLTARDRRIQRQSLLRRMLMPGLIASVFALVYLYYSLSSPQLPSGGQSALQFSMMLITVSIVPAILVWTLTGVFQAVQESFSLLAEDSRSAASLTMDDMVSVSSMSSADIAVGALQVILPPLFWRSFAVSLAYWWVILMMTSLFGTDLRSESFITAWTWGIVTFLLMLLSSLLASAALVLACISAGLRNRGALVPLSSAVLIMAGTFAWSYLGAVFLVNDDLALKLTRLDSVLGSAVFLVLALLLAQLLRFARGSHGSLGILFPLLAGLCVWAYFSFIAGADGTFGEGLSRILAAIVRSWGSFSLINPLFIPSAASWGDVPLRNPVTGETGLAASLELRWIVGFITQLGLVWINAWLAWHCIARKRSS
jgi:hypothetical protein